MSRRVVAVVDDLFFVAKIREAARHAGVEILFVEGVEELVRQAGEETDLVIVDLNAKAVDPLEAVRRLRADAAGVSVPVLGFFAHLQTELAAKAREAGCERVIARSQLSAHLVDLLRSG